MRNQKGLRVHVRVCVWRWKYDKNVAIKSYPRGLCFKIDEGARHTV